MCVFWSGPVSNALLQLPLPLTGLRDATRWTDRQTDRGEAAGDRKSFRMLRKEAEDKTAPRSSLSTGMRALRSMSQSEENIKAWRATAPLSPPATHTQPFHRVWRLQKWFSSHLHILKTAAKDGPRPKMLKLEASASFSNAPMFTI